MSVLKPAAYPILTLYLPYTYTYPRAEPKNTQGQGPEGEKEFNEGKVKGGKK